MVLLLLLTDMLLARTLRTMQFAVLLLQTRDALLEICTAFAIFSSLRSCFHDCTAAPERVLLIESCFETLSATGVARWSGVGIGGRMG